MSTTEIWDEVYYILQRYQTAQIKILQLKFKYKDNIPAPTLAQILLLKEQMDADEAELRRLIPNFDNQ